MSRYKVRVPFHFSRFLPFFLSIICFSKHADYQFISTVFLLIWLLLVPWLSFLFFLSVSLVFVISFFLFYFIFLFFILIAFVFFLGNLFLFISFVSFSNIFQYPVTIGPSSLIFFSYFVLSLFYSLFLCSPLYLSIIHCPFTFPLPLPLFRWIYTERASISNNTVIRLLLLFCMNSLISPSRTLAVRSPIISLCNSLKLHIFSRYFVFFASNSDVPRGYLICELSGCSKHKETFW